MILIGSTYGFLSRIERAKIAREGEQMVVAQPLIGEINHIVAVPSGLDRFDFGARHASEIYALDFGAEGRERTHLDVEHGGHAADIIAK